MASSTGRKKKRPHPLIWIAEPLMEAPGYLERSMFGCLALYLHGRLVLVLADGEEPWNGLLVPTDHRFHESICREFPGTVQHPVLKKWLYLPLGCEDFESSAAEIAEAARIGDERFGVEPKERKTKKRAASN